MPDLTIVMVSHRDHATKAEGALHRELGKLCRLVEHHVEDGWPARVDDVASLREADVCLWYVNHFDLFRHPPFDWTGFDGLRVCYETDAHQNYVRLVPEDKRGAWSTYLPRGGFDLVVATGREVTRRLNEEDIRAAWLPKAFDEDLDGWAAPRIDPVDVGFMGMLYPARRRMLATLERAGLPVERTRVPYVDVAHALRSMSAMLICNMGFRYRGGAGGRLAWRLTRDPRMFGIVPGLEPMFKNFEAAAAGCVPIADRIAELDDLGFEHGRNVVLYDDFDELVDIVRWCASHRREADRIGAAAADLAWARHTWGHRARELVSLLGQYLGT